jgi:hypothetical protein
MYENPPNYKLIQESSQREVDMQRYTLFMFVLIGVIALLITNCEHLTDPSTPFDQSDGADLAPLAKPSGNLSFLFENLTGETVTALALQFNAPLTSIQIEAEVGILPVTDPDLIGDWTVVLVSIYDPPRFYDVIDYINLSAISETNNLKLKKWQWSGPEFQSKLYRNCNNKNGCSVTN